MCRNDSSLLLTSISSKEPLNLLEPTHIDCSLYQLLLAQLWTVINALLSFASQMCHTLRECLTVLCPEKVNRNCSRDCLYCFFQLSLCLAVCLLNLTSPPSWLGGVSTAVSTQHSSYATWQKVMCQRILGAFSPHSVSCVDLKISELNY